MKPYGRIYKTKGWPNKRSYFKEGNWWEDNQNFAPRKTLKKWAFEQEELSEF